MTQEGILYSKDLAELRRDCPKDHEYVIFGIHSIVQDLCLFLIYHRVLSEHSQVHFLIPNFFI